MCIYKNKCFEAFELTDNITVRDGDNVGHTISGVDHCASQRPVLAL